MEQTNLSIIDQEAESPSDITLLQNRLVRFIRRETSAEREDVFRGYQKTIDARVRDGICLRDVSFLYEQISGCYVYGFKPGSSFQFSEGELVVINQGIAFGDAIGDGDLMWINEINHAEKTIVLEKAGELPENKEPPANKDASYTIDKGFSDLNSSRLMNSVRIALAEQPKLARLILGQHIPERPSNNIVYWPRMHARTDSSANARVLCKSPDNAVAAIDAALNSHELGFTLRQLTAFNRAFSEPVSLIQGPPGTGKTRLLAQIILRALKEKKTVLVTAYTHAAIDNLLETVAASADLASYTLFKLHGRSKSKSLPGAVTQMEFNSEELENLLRFPIVVGATVYQAYKMQQAQLPSFDLVIVDEAGQMPIPHALAAMICGEHYVLAGDHKQLPPIVKAHHPEDEEAISIFERLNKLYPSLNVELDITFRMNKEINEFPSKTFYGGTLTPAPQNAHRTFNLQPDVTTLQHVIDRDESVTFVEVQHNSCSKMSRIEAGVVAQLAYTLLIEHQLPPSELAIISPHKQHNVEIRKRLAKMFTETPGWGAKSTMKQLLVDTVEKMQGREREVVIFSLCASKRAYLQQRAQFLYKPNRLNVAITRSRSKLFVVGSRNFFPCESQLRINPKSAEIFDQYYSYLMQHHVPMLNFDNGSAEEIDDVRGKNS